MQSARALKLRKGPLQLLWDEEKYMENSNVEAGGTGASTRGNAKRLSEVIADSLFWCYLDAWQCIVQ